MFGGEGAVLPRPSRLVERTLGRTLGLVGSLALRLGTTRRLLLILGGIAASVLLLGLSVVALALLGG